MLSIVHIWLTGENLSLCIWELLALEIICLGTTRTICAHICDLFSMVTFPVWVEFISFFVMRRHHYQSC